MNKLIMLVGIAASGKSFVAHKLLKEGKVDKIISSDALRAELYGDENDQNHNKEIFDEVHKRIRKFLKEGYNVCYDATNLSSKRRMNFLKQLSNLNIKKECIVVLAPIEDCMCRNMKRARSAPLSVIFKMVGQFQCPFYFEGWDKIELHYIFDEPYNCDKLFELANNFDQSNPHHLEDLGTHLDITAREVYDKDNINNNLCVKAAIFHDLGKLYTQTFENKKGIIKYFKIEEKEKTIAHYYGHEGFSTYLFLISNLDTAHVMVNFKIYVANLIQYHMEFYKREEKGLERFLNKLPKEFEEDLIRLHNADMLSRIDLGEVLL